MTINSTERRSSVWPYPVWIAHRGAGLLAPENTLAAIRFGAAQGFRMFEFDAQISADQSVVLMHDATLARTTNGEGAVARMALAQLARLDAGSWHSPAYAGEPIPTLEQVALWLQAEGLFANIEIKPVAGLESLTGRVVTQEALRLWPTGRVAPLLSSFSTEALQESAVVAPLFPRALLADVTAPRWVEGGGAQTQTGLGCDPFAAILSQATALGTVAVVVQHRGLNAQRIAMAHAAGMRVLTYTLNDSLRAADLLAAGLDGVITDAVDRMGPAAG